MTAIFIIPQLPLNSRYTSFIHRGIAEQIRKMGQDVEVLTLKREPVKVLTTYFTNEPEAIKYETRQILELHDIVQKGDKVLWMDLDFPGFSVPMAYYLKRKGVLNYGIIHGAYFNEGDYWQGIDRKNFMRAEIDVCEKVFVGSEYFANRLISILGSEYSQKIKVTGLPFEKSYYENLKQLAFVTKKENLIYSPNKEIEIEGFEVWGKEKLPHDEFLKKLARTKFALIFKKAETFGYTVLEALALNVMTIVPSDFSYIEFSKKVGVPSFLNLELCFESAINYINYMKDFLYKDEEDTSRRANSLSPLFMWLFGSSRRIAEEVVED